MTRRELFRMVLAAPVAALAAHWAPAAAGIPVRQLTLSAFDPNDLLGYPSMGKGKSVLMRPFFENEYVYFFDEADPLE